VHPLAARRRRGSGQADPFAGLGREYESESARTAAALRALTRLPAASVPAMEQRLWLKGLRANAACLRAERLLQSYMSEHSQLGAEPLTYEPGDGLARLDSDPQAALLIRRDVLGALSDMYVRQTLDPAISVRQFLTGSVFEAFEADDEAQRELTEDAVQEYGHALSCARGGEARWLARYLMPTR
jgi:hypothetical protein